jgi:serine/threonine-protein kinase
LVQRFSNEARIQAGLSHPNIVPVYDFVANFDTLAIIMEFVEGVTLEEAIAQTRGRGLPEQRASSIMRQVLLAAGFAHARGLVHRDLKPGNIMLQRLGGDDVVRVTDFGVAKILGVEGDGTAASARMGTLPYMSPEHVRSPKSVDTRSDIYSLGIVLFEMLTGVIPFDGDSEYEIMRAIVGQPLRLDRVPDPFRFIIARAVAKRPGDRFQSCEEMRASLPGATSPARASTPISTVDAAVAQKRARLEYETFERSKSVNTAAVWTRFLAEFPGPGPLQGRAKDHLAEIE